MAVFRVNRSIGWSELATLLQSRDRLPEGLDKVVERKFRRVLHHAATTVPRYRRLCAEAAIDPDRIDLTALERLPLTRREDWKARPISEFLSTAVTASRCHWVTSTGTGGVPVALPYTLWDRAARRVGTQRLFWAAGIGVRERYAWVRSRKGRRIPPAVHERLGFLRVLTLDALTPPDRYWAALAGWAPRGLLGHALHAEVLAGLVRDGRLSRLARSPLLALYGEPLEPGTRATIEAHVGPVRDMYGSAEGGTIAWECGQGPGLHVNADLVIVEFLRDGRRVAPGTPGEIVITNLHSWPMPVIRYGQGDTGWEIPGPCPCGRPGPLMQMERRFRLGPFRLPSGRRVGARFFTWTLPFTYPFSEWFVRWDADQPAADALRLVLTVTRPLPASETRALAGRLAAACWEPVRVSVEWRYPDDGSGRVPSEGQFRSASLGPDGG